MQNNYEMIRMCILTFGLAGLSWEDMRKQQLHGWAILLLGISGMTISLLGLSLIHICVLAAFVAGAVLAVLTMLYMRNLRISLFKAQVFLRELFSGKFSSYRNGWVQEQNLMHFSVAVLLGMLYAHRTVWLSLF